MPGKVTLQKDAQNLIGISIGGGAQYCPCLYIVQVLGTLEVGLGSWMERVASLLGPDRGLSFFHSEKVPPSAKPLPTQSKQGLALVFLCHPRPFFAFLGHITCHLWYLWLLCHAWHHKDRLQFVFSLQLVWGVPSIHWTLNKNVISQYQDVSRGCLAKQRGKTAK